MINAMLAHRFAAMSQHLTGLLAIGQYIDVGAAWLLLKSVR